MVVRSITLQCILKFIIRKLSPPNKITIGQGSIGMSYFPGYVQSMRFLSNVANILCKVNFLWIVRAR